MGGIDSIMEERKYCLGAMAVLILLLGVGIVSSAGVTLPNWEDNPATVNAGQNGEITLYLQNMVGEQDLVFEISYKRNDGDITWLDDTEYDVPVGRNDVPVGLNYKIPDDAQIGSEYLVTLSFRSRSPNIYGGIETGVGMTRSIPFVVVPETVQQSPGAGAYGFIWYLVGVLVVAGVVVYFVMRKKK